MVTSKLKKPAAPRLTSLLAGHLCSVRFHDLPPSAVAAAKASLFDTLGVMLVAGRMMHAFGLARSTGTSIGRAGGILLTWLMILVASVLAIFDIVAAYWA